jgi:hypothetical protein
MEVRCVETMPLTTGGTFEWEFADPGKLLANMVDRSPALNLLFAEAASKHPPSIERPWSLVVGFDEFTPGDKLKVDNRRKTMVLSFSFLELGQVALSKAVAWQSPVCLRATVIHQIDGGWSHCLKRYLHKQLLGTTGLAGAGLPLVVNGQPMLLFARLTNLLSDGDGLRQALDWRGHASLKPCFKHFNVFKKDGLETFIDSPLSCVMVQRPAAPCMLRVGSDGVGGNSFSDSTLSCDMI